MEPNKQFRACRELVHDDAFEAKITVHMARPLLRNVLGDLKRDYLNQPSLFLRRSLTRYLTLVVYRLTDKPNDRGQTGATASVSSLLEMARSERVLGEDQVQTLITEFEKIKADAAEGGYDLVQAVRYLRNTQVAHSLIPWKDPEDQVWASHLLDFAEAIFDFVVKLEVLFAAGTSVTLVPLPEPAVAFQSDANQFWQALTSMK